MIRESIKVTCCLILIFPASVNLDLPDGVADKLEKDYPPKIKTLWKLGGPPLGSADESRFRAAHSVSTAVNSVD